MQYIASLALLGQPQWGVGAKSRSFWLWESPPNSINLSHGYLILWCWCPKILQLVQVKSFKTSWWPCSQAAKWFFFISRAISLQSTRTGSCSEALWLEAAISRHVGGFFFAMRCSWKTTSILSLTLARCSQKDFSGVFDFFSKQTQRGAKSVVYSLLFLAAPRLVVILHPCQISTQFIAWYSCDEDKSKHQNLSTSPRSDPNDLQSLVKLPWQSTKVTINTPKRQAATTKNVG